MSCSFMFAIGYHRLSQFDVALVLDCDSDPFSPMNEAQRAGKELFLLFVPFHTENTECPVFIQHPLL
jgi:hypothetical protein